MRRPLYCAVLPVFAACVPAPMPGERPMDEVPALRVMANGDRHYSFDNGCVVVLQPRQAVVRAESAECELHHRDIALLYASAD